MSRGSPIQTPLRWYARIRLHLPPEWQPPASGTTNEPRSQLSGKSVLNLGFVDLGLLPWIAYGFRIWVCYVISSGR